MFKALFMAIGMFSVLPVPKRHWDDRHLPWLIPMLPVVGGLIGGIWYAVALCCGRLPLPVQYATVLLTPFLLSGFFHLDGFMDTADAFFSRRDLEEKKRILKDSHVGAFAVIALASLFLAQFCAIQAILDTKKPLALLVMIPIVSRCVVGILLLRMKPMPGSSYAAMCTGKSGTVHLGFLVGIFIVTASVSFFLLGATSFVILAVEAVSALVLMLYLGHEFQGVSGDLCGCSITLSEFVALLSLALI